MNSKNRSRAVAVNIFVSEQEEKLIRERMEEAGTKNRGAFIRKMTLNGYIIHVDLSPVRDLVKLQRTCANNLNQIAVQAYTYGIYKKDISMLKKDYEALWKPLTDLLKQLAEVVRL